MPTIPSRCHHLTKFRLSMTCSMPPTEAPGHGIPRIVSAYRGISSTNRIHAVIGGRESHALAAASLRLSSITTPNIISMTTTWRIQHQPATSSISTSSIITWWVDCRHRWWICIIWRIFTSHIIKSPDRSLLSSSPWHPSRYWTWDITCSQVGSHLGYRI